MVQETSLDNNTFTSSSLRIASSPLTSGVHTFTFNKWASLAIHPSWNVLMSDTGRSDKIAMVSFRVAGRGRVVVWADINCFDPAQSKGPNKHLFRNLAHAARANRMEIN